MKEEKKEITNEEYNRWSENVGIPDRCPYRKIVSFSPGSKLETYCAKNNDTIVFQGCLKCDAFKGKDSLDKTWDSDAKDPVAPLQYRDACPHFHESDFGDWCELYGCEQVFERCEKCCACNKEVDSWNKFPKCALMKQTFYSDTTGKKFVNCDLKRVKVTLKECLCCEHSVSNDQTAKADAGKAQLSLVPQKIIHAIARIREYGNNKYPEGGKDNWKSVEKQRYVDAMLRHISAYVSDPEGVDEESGFPHLYHAATNLAFILEMEGE